MSYLLLMGLAFFRQKWAAHIVGTTAATEAVLMLRAQKSPWKVIYCLFGASSLLVVALPSERVDTL